MSRADKHDRVQAERRSRQQNEAIIKLVREHGKPGDLWFYSDVKKTGDPVTLGISGGQQWTITAGGVIQ